MQNSSRETSFLLHDETRDLCVHGRPSTPFSLCFSRVHGDRQPVHANLIEFRHARSFLYHVALVLAHALLLSPLLFWEPIDFFFDSTKVFFLMALAQALLITYAWLAWSDRRYPPRLTALAVAFYLYIALLVGTSFVGVDPFLSFWGRTDRITGGLFWMHMAVLFFVLTAVLRKQEDWRAFFFTGSVVGILVSLVFFLTQLDPSFFLDSRQGSTLGNSSFLGTYLLFALFFSLAFTVMSSGRASRWFGGIASAIVVVALLFSEANAALIAFFGAVVLAGALWGACSKRWGIRWGGRALVGALLIVFVVLSVQVFKTGSSTNQWFLSHTGNARLVVWESTWQAIEERPWVGWGMENFPTAFAAYYNPCFGSIACGTEVWFDRAHNKILDTLIEGGIVALLGYVSLLGAVLWSLWRARFGRRVSTPMAILVTSFFAAYIVQNLAGFDTGLFLALFTIVIGFVCVVSARPALESHRVSPMRRWLFVLSLLVTLVWPYTFYHAVLYPIQTNRSLQVHEAKTIEERLEVYRALVFGSPIGIDFRRAYTSGLTAQWVMALSQQERERLSSAIASEWRLATEGLELSVARSPNFLRGANLLGLMYLMDGLSGNLASFERGHSVLEQSLTRNPHNQNAYYPLGALEIAMGNYQEARRLFTFALEMDPAVPESHLDAFVALKLMGTDQAQLQEQGTAIIQAFPSLSQDIEYVLGFGEERRTDQLFLYFF